MQNKKQKYIIAITNAVNNAQAQTITLNNETIFTEFDGRGNDERYSFASIDKNLNVVYVMYNLSSNNVDVEEFKRVTVNVNKLNVEELANLFSLL